METHPNYRVLGIALNDLPQKVEVASILEASVLGRYNESVTSAYNSERARKVLGKFGQSGEELAGANPFMLVHLQNSGLINGRIATRRDLENALRFSPRIFSGDIIDFGLALRTAQDSYSNNSFLAKNLADQLQTRGITLKKGKLLPFSSLRLRENEDSAYGLFFDLKDEANEFEDLDSYYWFHAREEGLAVACLYGVEPKDWCSEDSDLSSSGSSGRVVVISEKPSGKFFKRLHVL